MVAAVKGRACTHLGWAEKVEEAVHGLQLGLGLGVWAGALLGLLFHQLDGHLGWRDKKQGVAEGVSKLAKCCWMTDSSGAAHAVFHPRLTTPLGIGAKAECVREKCCMWESTSCHDA
jgi:hypothetical protein